MADETAEVSIHFKTPYQTEVQERYTLKVTMTIAERDRLRNAWTAVGTSNSVQQVAIGLANGSVLMLRLADILFID